MKISACVQIPQGADPERFEVTEQMKFRKLMEEAVSEMEPERWYAVKLGRETSMEYGVDGVMLKTSLTVSPATEKTAVYIPPEDMFLKDKNETSFWQKLKNCIAYLTDKTGGKMEWRRKRGNEDEKL